MFVDAYRDRFGVEMLLSVSSGHGCVLQDAEEATGEVAFDAAEGFAFGLAFGDAALDVGAGFGVGFGADDRGLVDGPVELAVTAAAEAMVDFPRFPGLFWFVDHATAAVVVWR